VLAGAWQVPGTKADIARQPCVNGARGGDVRDVPGTEILTVARAVPGIENSPVAASRDDRHAQARGAALPRPTPPDPG